MDAERARDVFTDDRVDAMGRAREVDGERLADGGADRLLRRRAIERHGAAEKRALAEIAEHEIGVGQGRGRAALAIAGGAGPGARAPWADANEPA